MKARRERHRSRNAATGCCTIKAKERCWLRAYLGSEPKPHHGLIEIATCLDRKKSVEASDGRFDARLFGRSIIFIGGLENVRRIDPGPAKLARIAVIAPMPEILMLVLRFKGNLAISRQTRDPKQVACRLKMPQLGSASRDKRGVFRTRHRRSGHRLPL